MRLGGIQQWITIRGEDRSKPVLLYLHGGPGDAQSSLPSVYAPLEKDFVLVQWDQRGAGRTLGHLDPDTQPTSLPQLISDAVELAKYLQSYLHTDKVVLMGHSWGSFLGVEIVHREPRLFRAYIGIAQVVSWREIVEAQYRYTLAQARARSDTQVVRELEELGGPPSNSFDHYLVLRMPLNGYLAPSDVQWQPKQYALLQQALTPEDLAAYYKALQNLTGMQSTVLAMDVTPLGFKFKLPMFFIQGADDHIVDPSIVARYVDKIQAPLKRLSQIDGAGHFIPETHTQRVLEEISHDLRLVPALNPAH